MALWLYPLTSTPGTQGYFECSNGDKVDATSENFVECILGETLKLTAWWEVRNLYNKICIKDEVYIYGGKSQGLIGYAVIIDKKDREKRIKLKFDIEESQNIIAAKIDREFFKMNLIRPPARWTAVIQIDEIIKKKLRNRIEDEVLNENSNSDSRLLVKKTLELVSSKEEIEYNLNTLEKYKNSSKYYNDYTNLIANGINFVVIKKKDNILIGPSRFIGYKENNIEKHRSHFINGGDTSRRISEIFGIEPIISEELEFEYRILCKNLGRWRKIAPGGKVRKYWLIEGDDRKHNRSNDLETQKKSLTNIRIGQAEFRGKLIDFWKGCSVTSCKAFNLLRASHIKPWSVSTNYERLDLYNGLLLTPNLDAAFDRGLISFSDRGSILISSEVSEQEKMDLGITSKMKMRRICPKHFKYLKYHRECVFIR